MAGRPVFVNVPLVLANVVWPALYLSQRYYSWWAIALGLVIETFALRVLLKQPLPKSFLMALAANAISALVGVWVFVWIGFAWEYLLSYTVYQIIPLGTFNLFGWLATTMLAAAFSTSIEWVVIRFLFRMPTTRRFVLLFFGANLITAGIALVTLIVSPIKF